MGVRIPPLAVFKEARMTRKQVLAVLFVALLVSAWGCKPPPRSIRWGTGSWSYRGGYSVVNTYVDQSLDSLIFFNTQSEKFSSFGNFAKKGRNVYEASYRMKGTGYEFRITRDVETGVMEIDGKTFQMAKGPVFLCNIREGSVDVRQVAVDISKGYVEFYFPEAEVDRLIEDNPTVREFVKRCGFSESKSD